MECCGTNNKIIILSFTMVTVVSSQGGESRKREREREREMLSIEHKDGRRECCVGLVSVA